MAECSQENRLRHRSADGEARKIVLAVERGGESLCVPSTMEGLLIYALKGAGFSYIIFGDGEADECLIGVNPICDEAARWASWRMSLAAKRYAGSYSS